ncbi:hypothetical protein [Herbaspirillum huttiense]|uniref:hypothetical protein n=1 Tax=Herbaspirillum huttiense TaxID=863372 RepID=UPI0039B053E7
MPAANPANTDPLAHDPLRLRLRKTLAGGRMPPVERPPQQLKRTVQLSSPACVAACRAATEAGHARPVMKQASAKQVQHEEYTQPLRVSQRQWT